MSEKEYEITDREKRLYKDNKARSRQGVRELTLEEQIQFLTYVIESNSGDMEFKLDLSRRDVEEVKDQFGIIVPEDARRVRAELLLEQDGKIAEMDNERKDVKTEQQIRQRRQDAADAKQRTEAVQRTMKNEKSRNAQKEWQEREARMKNESKLPTMSKDDWRLPSTEDDNSDMWDYDAVIRFKNDVLGRGINFTMSKYDISSEDIRREAIRLELNINDWSMVRR